MLMDLEDTAGQVRFLIRDRDILYPPGFNQVLADAGIETVRGAVRAPRMNSIMERWIGSVRRELLDRTLVWNLRRGQPDTPGKPPGQRQWRVLAQYRLPSRTAGSLRGSPPCR
jgi:transposase InsO family protein